MRIFFSCPTSGGTSTLSLPVRETELVWQSSGELAIDFHGHGLETGQPEAATLKILHIRQRRMIAKSNRLKIAEKSQ